MDFVYFDRAGDGVAFALASGEREREGEEHERMERELHDAESLSISGEKSKIFPQAMPGYSGTPLVRKLGIRPNERLIALNAPEHYARLLVDLPEGVQTTKRLIAGASFVHLFVRERAELARRLHELRGKLNDAGVLWISWPKKAAKVATDITEDVIRAEALPLGFVDVKVCAVDETWSGLKLMIRREKRKSKG